MNDVGKKEIGINEKLSFGNSLFYGFQSVIALNLFLGAIIISGILQLDVASTAIMITMSFLASGIATLIQAGLFMKYPVVQGVSFATIGAIVAIAMKHDLATAFGSLILGAVIILLLGYFNLFSKILKFIPPLVSGVIVIVIGISLMFTASSSLISSQGNPGNNFAEAGITFVLIILFVAIGNSRLRIANIIGRGSVLLAIVIATIIAACMGQTDFSAVAKASCIPHPVVKT
jgi:NCS2 family nucleobase:cation symporter-2